jgi:hypothetical protein
VDDAVERLGNLPDLLDTERPDLRARLKAEAVEGDSGEVALRALGEDRHARGDVGAGLEVRKLFAAAPPAAVAAADADDASAGDEELASRRLGNERRPALLGALGKPGADLGDGRHVVPVVPHRRRSR